jgi:hypothetical protein
MNPATGTAGAGADYPSIEAFESGMFDPITFDHRAHVFVGWSYLRRCGLAEAVDRYGAALRRLTRKLGLETKYNETITWFFLCLISERMTSSPDATWKQFSNQHRDLCDDGAGLLRRYYSSSRLHSDQARCSFLLPDKNPQANELGK